MLGAARAAPSIGRNSSGLKQNHEKCGLDTVRCEFCKRSLHGFFETLYLHADRRLRAVHA